jgi:hypothetical protein
MDLAIKDKYKIGEDRMKKMMGEAKAKIQYD